MFLCLTVLLDSFHQDDSTRQSQDSNYSDEGGMSVSALGVSALGSGSERQELVANDDSNMSFPPMSDNARQSVQDTDADPDMRLGQLPAFWQSLKILMILAVNISLMPVICRGFSVHSGKS